MILFQVVKIISCARDIIFTRDINGGGGYVSTIEEMKMPNLEGGIGRKVAFCYHLSGPSTEPWRGI